MLAACVITALAIMYLSKCAKCGRYCREIDYLKSENADLREAIFGRRKRADPLDDFNYDNTKWYEIK